MILPECDLWLFGILPLGRASCVQGMRVLERAILRRACAPNPVLPCLHPASSCSFVRGCIRPWQVENLTSCCSCVRPWQVENSSRMDGGSSAGSEAGCPNLQAARRAGRGEC